MKAFATLIAAGVLAASGLVGAAPVTVEGTLVDSACYLKDGATTNDHGAMKACGTMCLKGGNPAPFSPRTRSCTSSSRRRQRLPIMRDFRCA